MTEQNVSLIKLSILLSRFSYMAKHNLSCGRESPKKSPKPQSPKVITETGPSAPSLRPPDHWKASKILPASQGYVTMVSPKILCLAYLQLSAWILDAHTSPSRQKTNAMHRAVLELYPFENGPHLTSLGRPGQKLGF